MADVFDLIVVGAGPGGSNAAAVALDHGLSVAQIDRHRFPRVKPCGGGFTMKSARAIHYDAGRVRRGEFFEVDINVWQRRAQHFSHPGSPLLRMVERAQFDAWLIEQNLTRSAFRFLGGERVLEVSHDGLFRVRTSSRTLAARQLVGADGAYSLVNRLFSVSRPKGQAVAVEVILPRDRAALPAELPPTFDLGAIERGYGWVFPKDDHWNVGLYTLGRSQSLRTQLVDYIRAKGFRTDTDPLATFAAHQFPYGGYRVAPPDVPVYLVGDAGGFGDALTGEGIYHALESGRLAGDVAHEILAGRADHRVYYRRLRRGVLAETFLTYQVARRFYRNVDRALSVLENPRISEPLLSAYAGGRTLAESLRRAGLVRSAARLVRARFTPRALRYRQVQTFQS